MPSDVLTVAPAKSTEALAHFEARLRFETDCWDVHAAMQNKPDFVLVDVRSPEAYAQGHAPGAVNIPHRTMTAERMAEYDENTAFVVYCAGPHCNGANKAAVRLAKLGRPVKEMIGGVVGWKDEVSSSIRNRLPRRAELKASPAAAAECSGSSEVALVRGARWTAESAPAFSPAPCLIALNLRSFRTYPSAKFEVCQSASLLESSGIAKRLDGLADNAVAALGRAARGRAGVLQAARRTVKVAVPYGSALGHRPHH